MRLPKTGYTYADTGSYNVIDQEAPIPNMSRSRLGLTETGDSDSMGSGTSWGTWFRRDTVSVISSTHNTLSSQQQQHQQEVVVSPRRLRSGRRLRVHFSDDSDDGSSNREADPAPEPRQQTVHRLSILTRILLFIMTVTRVDTLFSKRTTTVTKERDSDSVLHEKCDGSNPTDSGVDADVEEILENGNHFSDEKMHRASKETRFADPFCLRKLLWPLVGFPKARGDTLDTSVTSPLNTMWDVVTFRFFRKTTRVTTTRTFVATPQERGSRGGLCCWLPLLLLALLVLLAAFLIRSDSSKMRDMLVSTKDSVVVGWTWCREAFSSVHHSVTHWLLPNLSSLGHSCICAPWHYLRERVHALWILLLSASRDPHPQDDRKEEISSTYWEALQKLQRSVDSLQLRVNEHEGKLQEHSNTMTTLSEADVQLQEQVNTLHNLYNAMDVRLLEQQRNVVTRLEHGEAQWTALEARLHLLLRRWTRVDLQVTNLRTQTVQMRSDLEHTSSQVTDNAASLANWRGEVDVVVKDLQEWKERMARTQLDMKEEQQQLQLKITSFERLLASLKPTAPSEDDGTSSLVSAELEALRGDFVKLHQRLDSVIEARGTLQETVEKVTALQERIGKLEVSTEMSGVSLDAAVESRILLLVQRALEKYIADPVGKPDFALESSGGSIMGTRCTKTYSERPSVISFFGIPLLKLHRSPRSVIQPSVYPGECWAFQGHHGQLVIQLAMEIHITAVTLEHIPRSLSLNQRIDSAPENFLIRGLHSEQDKDGVLLGKFTYTDDGHAVQTFPIERVERTFRFVELEVLSNHGNPEYTCVYRLRVHGDLPKEVKEPH